jgi:hypothetical protein
MFYTGTTNSVGCIWSMGLLQEPPDLNRKLRTAVQPESGVHEILQVTLLSDS